MADALNVVQYEVADISLGAEAPPDPWAELDVTVRAPDGTERIVPAFIQDGGWRLRYSSDLVGEHRWSAAGSKGQVQVVEQTDPATRLSHGPLRVAADKRHLEHADGTPFLWLADTWWHGFVTNKSTDQEFADLAAQRAAQGFSVVQIVAGLPCEVEPFDRSGASRTGWAWTDGFAAPNLAWWDDADVRVQTLLRNDLMPCLLGSWGFHFSMMDTRQMTRHWREMIARWGAYPIVWCIAGEPPLLWDLLPLIREPLEQAFESGADLSFDQMLEHAGPNVAEQLKQFNHMAGVIRRMEPFGRLITTHSVPRQHAWEFLADPHLVDFWMLQTGHRGFNGLKPAIDAVVEAIEHEPTKPVINGEPTYEGIAGSGWQEIQRFLFWSHMLSGAAGHTYGAHGVWAFNTPEFPGQYSGLAPSWKEAAKLPGGEQVGIGAQLLLNYPWHELTPDPTIISRHQTAEERFRPYAARLPDGRRLIYVPSMAMTAGFLLSRLLNLGTAPWTVRYIDLTTGQAQTEMTVQPDENGHAELPFALSRLWPFPSWADWLVELTPGVLTPEHALS